MGFPGHSGELQNYPSLVVGKNTLLSKTAPASSQAAEKHKDSEDTKPRKTDPKADRGPKHCVLPDLSAC